MYPLLRKTRCWCTLLQSFLDNTEYGIWLLCNRWRREGIEIGFRRKEYCEVLPPSRCTIRRVPSSSFNRGSVTYLDEALRDSASHCVSSSLNKHFFGHRRGVWLKKLFVGNKRFRPSVFAHRPTCVRLTRWFRGWIASARWKPGWSCQ